MPRIPSRFANTPDVTITGIDDVIRKFNTLMAEVEDQKDRKRILNKAATVVAKQAREIAPRSTKPHFRYLTPKFLKGRRAARGAAKDYRIEYVPGNLRKSIQRLSLRRSPRVFIGPVYGKRGQHGPGDRVGTNAKNVDAYYAHMIYGSARAFGNKVMQAALQQSATAVTNKIIAEVDKLLRKGAQKAGLKRA